MTNENLNRQIDDELERTGIVGGSILREILEDVILISIIFPSLAVIYVIYKLQSDYYICDRFINNIKDDFKKYITIIAIENSFKASIELITKK